VGHALCVPRPHAWGRLGLTASTFAGSPTARMSQIPEALRIIHQKRRTPPWKLPRSPASQGSYRYDVGYHCSARFSSFERFAAQHIWPAIGERDCAHANRPAQVQVRHPRSPDHWYRFPELPSTVFAKRLAYGDVPGGDLGPHLARRYAWIARRWLFIPILGALSSLRRMFWFSGCEFGGLPLRHRKL
jgi:hypothetical protein